MRDNQCVSCAAEMREGEGQVCSNCWNKHNNKISKKYAIFVEGCHDETRIELDLTETEYILAKKIADEICGASSFGCMPTMGVCEIK